MLGERGGSPAVVKELNSRLGLDKPIMSQYFYFVSNALQGDFGQSIVSKESVSSEFFARFPATLELAFIGLLIAIVLGVPMGILAAVKKNSIYGIRIRS